MTLTPIGDEYEIAAINLVRGDHEPELSHRLAEPLEDGELLLNMRVEAAPEVLNRASEAALRKVIEQGSGLSYRITHAEHFRPGQPVPTHRMVEA